LAITLSSTGYCEASDVGSLLTQWGVSATDDPTEAEIEGWITEDFEQINARLRGNNFAAPVAQAGGSLSVTSGNITLNVAVDEGDTVLQLDGTGLAGVVRAGDWFLITGDAQRYMATREAVVSDDNEVVVYISPSVEVALAAGTAVTFNGSAGPAVVLKKLNAHMVAKRVLLSKFAGYDEAGGGYLEPFQTEIDKLEREIDTGKYDFPSLSRPKQGGRLNAQVVRV
jgi:hypothetical protein